MNTETITTSTKLAVITCPNCAGTYALAQVFVDEARQEGGFKKPWACPYCKQERGYGESCHEREKRQLLGQITDLKQTANILRNQRDTAEQEREHFRKSRDGMKGVVAKVKKRIGHGVCPCCHRTFKQLAAHMASKHPAFANSEP